MSAKSGTATGTYINSLDGIPRDDPFRDHLAGGPSSTQPGWLAPPVETGRKIVRKRRKRKSSVSLLRIFGLLT